MAQTGTKVLTAHVPLSFRTSLDILVYRFQNRSRNMLAIRLPAEVEIRLEALAKATGRTKTFYAREAILEHLDDLEDLYLAEQRLMDIRAGKTQTVSLEEVMKRYGLGD
ncbi:DUF6290 family protein [Acidithiobacillus sp. YTS05]|nr:DUF6290 family protein [Acidithiobacillus sp. YTS05]